MHELSIAQALIETAETVARREGARRVVEVRVTVGVLSGVEPGALDFCWDVATRGTLLEGSRLVQGRVPVVLHCTGCQHDTELWEPRGFRCSHCGRPSTELRSGRELELETLEIEDPEIEGPEIKAEKIEKVPDKNLAPDRSNKNQPSEEALS